MEREPENDEQITEVDSKDRKKSGDELDTTPDQMGASKGKSGRQADGASRPSESQGDERQRIGNKKPEPAGPETS